MLVGLWEIVLFKSINKRNPSPLWVAPFPRQGVYVCVCFLPDMCDSREIELSTRKQHMCINFSLLLTLDVI